ncbi:MAG: hypothetical protein DRJ42_26760 [Deltaproteobacteria bacterium]|nr:MAG: hypothetical protein DRJ42_26760 [Deltaproteobacteria bacterium]
MRIDQEPARYLRSPRLVPRGAGAMLHLLSWEEEGDRVLVFGIDADGQVGEVGEADSGPFRDAISGITGGPEPRATDDPAIEDRDEADGHLVRIERAGYRSRVILTVPGRDEVEVFDAWGTAAAPCLAVTDDGVWVAFHHNVREDTGAPDLAKWVALRFVDREGRVFEPAAPMVDRNRDREGEEQSFEFPSLVTSKDGAVALFGRGSHCFYRQDLNADGFSPRRALGDDGWGCRGRRVAVATMASGRVITARRERKGIEVEVLDGPAGGAPRLLPVDAAFGRSVEVAAEALALDGRPDPAAAAGRMTLFGDIHQHSAHSDGIGTADEPYLRARHLYGDDFCALTDHESFLGKRIGPGEWRYLKQVAERHDDEGEFATLIAFEWTGRMHPGPGHKVVYLPDADGAVISRDDVPEGEGLVAAAAQAGAFAVPHHVGWTGADEGAHDPEHQPVWEICSCHGCYEYFAHELGQRGDLRDQMVDAVLRRGHRFGFIASSDGHGLLFHHGMARKRDPFRTGLTAVQATGRNRAAILDAMRSRRCYATSGVKILLDLEVGGQPMGGQLPRVEEVAIRAFAHGTADLASIELVGPDGVVAVGRTDGATGELDARGAAPWLYLRVRQEDGEMAWSSPVFMG